jgi:hypothetical protein
MTYRIPKPLNRALKCGDEVEVCDRDLSPMSRVRVARSGKRVVRLRDGRRFDAQTGYWIGENRRWPFPSIRPVR